MLCLSTIAGAPICADQPRKAIPWGIGEAPGSFVIQGEAEFQPIAGYLTRKNWLSFTDFLGAAAATKMLSWTEVNIGQPDGFGGVIWGGWQKFSPGQYQGQYARLRYYLQAPTPQIVGELLEAQALCSVAERLDSYTDLTVPAAGLAISFAPGNSNTPRPFNKGPNGTALPQVMVVWNNQPGDQLIRSGLSLSGVAIQILNGGVGVPRTGVDVTAAGY